MNLEMEYPWATFIGHLSFVAATTAIYGLWGLLLSVVLMLPSTVLATTYKARDTKTKQHKFYMLDFIAAFYFVAAAGLSIHQL